jgi:CheY-like chemotaxis protein
MGHKTDIFLETNSPAPAPISNPLNREDKAVHGREVWIHSKWTTREREIASRQGQTTDGKAVSPGSRNILLVSDDEGQRSLLRAYLQHVGFKVFSCADMDSALRMIAGGCSVQLLLVDSHLLADAAHRLNEMTAEHCPDPLVFAISGKRTADGTLLEVKHRVCGQDSQSFQLPDLLGRIQALVETAPSEVPSDPDAEIAETGKILAFPGSASAQSKAANAGGKGLSGKDGAGTSKATVVQRIDHR